MKLKIILGFILLLFVFSCKKDTNGGPIIGKWRTTEIFLGPLMSSEPLYVQFIAPNKVQSTFFSKCTGYSIYGNNLTLKYNGVPGLSQVTYTYTIKQDTLTLYSNSSDCSGCSFPFVKE